MTAFLAFDVDGEPIPQGSKKAIPHRSTGRAILIDDNSPKLKAWRHDVAVSARAAMNGPRFPIDGPVTVGVFFYLTPPKRPRWSVPAVRPDVDKLARAILDALTDAGVWKDDGQVTHLDVRKRYAAAGKPWASVMVTEER